MGKTGTDEDFSFLVRKSFADDHDGKMKQTKPIQNENQVLKRSVVSGRERTAVKNEASCNVVADLK